MITIITIRTITPHAVIRGPRRQAGRLPRPTKKLVCWGGY